MWLAHRVAAEDIAVRRFAPGDRTWADALISRHQGSSRTARLGVIIDPRELDGLVAARGERSVGLLTFRVVDDQFEVITLHVTSVGTGAGGVLLHAARDEAKRVGCRRLWLMTTNDNLDALGFYQRQGLRLCALHAGAVDADRRLKPEIPVVNPANGIEVHDLLELELRF